MKRLTTTSYALLGLLYVRPWSGYELTEQMKRGIGVIWPRAERAIYDEPRNLVEHGLAKAAEEMVGRRPRTVYSITAKGRRELAKWLAQPEIAPPQIAIEAFVRLAFAPAGRKEDLLRAMRSVREYGEELKQRMLGVAGGYLHGEGPFPERTHLIALMAPFMIGWADLLISYGRWAEEQVERWPDVKDPSSFTQAQEVLAEVVAGTLRFDAALAAAT